MDDLLTFHVAALVLTAATFDVMVISLAVFAPAVFRLLPREEVAPFIRALFLVYSQVMGIATTLAVLFLLVFPRYLPEALKLLAVAAIFFAQRYALLPALNRHREEGTEARASGLHRFSVGIHMAQCIAIAVILVRLAV